MKSKFFHIVCAVALFGVLLPGSLSAQHSERDKSRHEICFYPTRFALDEVTLLDGPFQRAQQLNFRTLMEYDVDRLLTPYVRQSGLAATGDSKSRYYQWEYRHPAFTSFAWNPALAMDGHMLGHYLSALSLAYAACHDPVQRHQLKERLDYVVHVLRDCQNVFDEDKDGMRGFLGGLPNNGIWTSLLDSDYRPYNQCGHWTPFYCEHKIAAGLRDAYLYGECQMAESVFRKLCDWLINVVSMFEEDVMEMQLLQWEPGAVNEVLADAYVLFDDHKYIKAAQKFSHQILIENMNNDERNVFLDKKHTNHFTAMFAGIGRIDQVKGDQRYRRGAQRYWKEVTSNRMSVIGGAGVGGYFVQPNKATEQLVDADGPDLCTTCNLLKLTETLYADGPSAEYVDYYERATLNHVLSDIDPRTGGFAFFTPLRSEAYRIYSKVNESMWCCAGSGLEAQSRYGEFIYSYCEDTLYVNLFIDSRLDSRVAHLEQHSLFPYGQSSRITIKKSGNFKLAVRHPSWATDGYKITINGRLLQGKQVQYEVGQASFVYCGKNWHQGDVIEVFYPMTITTETCPGVSDYVALKYGPTVLAAQTTDADPDSTRYEPLPNEYGGEGMHDFSPQSREKFPNVAYSPMFICEADEVQDRVRLVDSSRLVFMVNATAPGSMWTDVRTIPFFDLHHTRYVLYWKRQNRESWLRSPIYQKYLLHLEQAARTYDEVLPGNDKSEENHQMKLSEISSRGSYNGYPFRDAQEGQWFEYTLDAQKAAEDLANGVKVVLIVRFTTIDKGRKCDIKLNDELVATYTVNSRDFGKEKFYEKTFSLAPLHLRDASSGVIRISSVDGSLVPRCFRILLMKDEE